MTIIVDKVDVSFMVSHVHMAAVITTSAGGLSETISAPLEKIDLFSSTVRSTKKRHFLPAFSCTMLYSRNDICAEPGSKGG